MSRTARDRAFLAEANKAYAETGDPRPICNLCGGRINPNDRWDISHFPIAKVFGGTRTGLAHARCNREHGAAVVTPAKAKADRVRRRHVGASGPGLGRNPMPAGKRSRLTKTFRNGVQMRRSLGEKVREYKAARFPLERTHDQRTDRPQDRGYTRPHPRIG